MSDDRTRKQSFERPDNPRDPDPEKVHTERPGGQRPGRRKKKQKSSREDKINTERTLLREETFTLYDSEGRAHLYRVRQLDAGVGWSLIPSIIDVMAEIFGPIIDILENKEPETDEDGEVDKEYYLKHSNTVINKLQDMFGDVENVEDVDWSYILDGDITADQVRKAFHHISRELRHEANVEFLKSLLQQTERFRYKEGGEWKRMDNCAKNFGLIYGGNYKELLKACMKTIAVNFGSLKGSK